jgi:hypothetical protein
VSLASDRNCEEGPAEKRRLAAAALGLFLCLFSLAAVRCLLPVPACGRGGEEGFGAAGRQGRKEGKHTKKKNARWIYALAYIAHGEGDLSTSET